MGPAAILFTCISLLFAEISVAVPSSRPSAGSSHFALSNSRGGDGQSLAKGVTKPSLQWSSSEAPCGDSEFSIRSVQPPFAFATSSTEVVIEGCGFPDQGADIGDTNVHIGVHNCTVHSLSKRRIKCTLPSSSSASGPSRVFVSTTSDGIEYSTFLDAGFNWYQPKIHLAVPSVVNSKAGARVRLSISGFYNLHYYADVEVEGKEASVATFHEKYVIIDLPVFDLVEDSKHASVSIFSRLPNEPRRLLAESAVLTLKTASGAFIRDCLPSWAFAKRPTETLRVYVSTLSPDTKYRVHLDDVDVGVLAIDYQEGILSAQIPVCQKSDCIGIVSLVLFADGLQLDTWQFTYLPSPASLAPIYYPGPVLPCNFRHEMLIIMRNFDFSVPAGLKLGEYNVSQDYNAEFYSSSEGFSFILKEAGEPYASGSVSLLDDARNVVFVADVFTHVVGQDQVATTYMSPSPMIIGYPTSLTVYGFGFKEVGAQSFAVADVLTPEAAAKRGGNANAVFFLHKEGLKTSSLSGFIHDCELDTSICKPGTFDLLFYDATGNHIATAHAAVPLRHNLAFGALLEVQFEREKTAEELGYFLTRFSRMFALDGLHRRLLLGNVGSHGRFEIIVTPEAYTRGPSSHELALMIEREVRDELSHIHILFPDLTTNVWAQRTVFRCDDGVYRITCGSVAPWLRSRRVWLYVGIGFLGIVIALGLIVFWRRRKAKQRRVALFMEETLDASYAEING